jgi:hypothetical protein
MNAFQYAFAAWVPIVYALLANSFMPSYTDCERHFISRIEGAEVRIVYEVTASFNVSAILLVSAIWYKSRRDEHRGVMHKDLDYHDSVNGSTATHRRPPVDQLEGRNEDSKASISQ